MKEYVYILIEEYENYDTAENNYTNIIGVYETRELAAVDGAKVAYDIKDNEEHSECNFESEDFQKALTDGRIIGFYNDGFCFRGDATVYIIKEEFKKGDVK